MKEYALHIWNFVKRNERILAPTALLCGLVWNSITLRRVDLLPETIILYIHLGLAALVLILEHWHETHPARTKFLSRLSPFFPLTLSFIFGSLFSIFSVFYAKSASLADSWPFMLVFVAVIVGNEIFKRYKERFVFNLSLYYLALFSFCILATPLWAGRIGTDIFVVSGVIALLVFSFFYFILYKIGKERIEHNFARLAVSVSLISLTIGILYITNMIPPIPLSLKDIGVYHSLVKTGNQYFLEGEAEPPYGFLFDDVVHVTPNEPIYVFSSVFTPVAITTNVVHRWEYWNASENEWITESVFSFPIGGGRDAGYRGFSIKEGLAAGKWRVSVETPEGLKIGRETFQVIQVAVPAPLVETVR